MTHLHITYFVVSKRLQLGFSLLVISILPTSGLDPACLDPQPSLQDGKCTCCPVLRFLPCTGIAVLGSLAYGLPSINLGMVDAFELRAGHRTVWKTAASPAGTTAGRRTPGPS